MRDPVTWIFHDDRGTHVCNTQRGEKLPASSCSVSKKEHPRRRRASTPKDTAQFTDPPWLGNLSAKSSLVSAGGVIMTADHDDDDPARHAKLAILHGRGESCGKKSRLSCGLNADESEY